MKNAGREEGDAFLPKFSSDGLITAIISEAGTGAPLMVAHMNAEALERSVVTGEAHFWSRSRGEIWHKGATSGNILTIREMRIDCDQDAVWLSVEIAGHGAACHTGRKSCFYRKVEIGPDGNTILTATGDAPVFDPADIYSK
ncbi:MAG: phosphoribosyl-AMP cyclohydrolase [Rhizobiaceae bacterium]